MFSSMGDFKDEPVTAKFNAAFASLERLHKLLEECNEVSRLCHMDGYNLQALKTYRFTVIALYKEVRPKLTTGKKEGEDEEIKKLFKKFKDIKDIITVKNSEEGIMQQVNVQKFNQYWKLISTIETKLRIMADRHGLLIPNSRGALDALENQ